MRTLNTLILAVGAILGATGLSAQTKAVANIPFDFTVSTVTLPAGTYTIQSSTAAHDAIQIVNKETRKSVFVLAPPSNGPYKGETGKVVFNRYGDRYFFSEVWTAAGLRGHAMPGKLERELQAGGAEMSAALVSIPLTATP